ASRLGGSGLRARRPVHELGLEARHHVALLFADRLAKVVGASRAEATDLLRDLHQLLLVDAATERRLRDRAKPLVLVADAGRVALATRIVGDEAHRAGPVEGADRD